MSALGSWICHVGHIDIAVLVAGIDSIEYVGDDYNVTSLK